MIKTASVKIKNKPTAAKTFIHVKPKAEDNLTQTLAQVKPDLEPENPKNNSVQTQIALVPDAAVSLKPQPETEKPAKQPEKVQVLASANTTEKVKRKRIRSFGDVVNLVMAKVDKREDKLIQFTNSDDGDESNVTGINLGIINLKKEK